MSDLRFVLSMAVVVIVVGTASAEEKKPTNKEKIIGVWEVTKAMPDPGYAKGAYMTVEYTKDGKFKRTSALAPGGKEKVEEGTYAVDGDKLTEMLPGKKEGMTLKITKLTDKALILEFGEKDEKATFELKKK